jgi:hypothetical protein
LNLGSVQPLPQLILGPLRGDKCFAVPKPSLWHSWRLRSVLLFPTHFTCHHFQKYSVRIVAVEKPTHLKQVMPQRQQNVPEPPR